MPRLRTCASMALRSRYSTTTIMSAVRRTTKHTTDKASLVRRRMLLKCMPCLTSLHATCLHGPLQPDLMERDIWIAKGADLNPFDVWLEHAFIRVVQQHDARRILQDMPLGLPVVLDAS